MGYGMVGEYLGFCFNNYHSSWFGITRTSSGDRYNQDLLPTVKDQTQEVPGMEGMLYFGQTWSKREFQVPFAFDSMSEGQYVALTAWLNEPNIKPLFFDETPHKVYSAKVTGKVTAKVVVFDDETGERVYRGDGSVTFTCYFPFAKRNSGTISVNNAFGTLITPRRITYKRGAAQICALGVSGQEEVVEISSATYAAMTSTAAMAPAPIYKSGFTTREAVTISGTNGSITLSGLTDCTIDGYQCLIYDDDGKIYNNRIVNGDFFWLLPTDWAYNTYTEQLYY